MSGQAEMCRKRADECKTLAAASDDPKVKEQYLDMVKVWLELARNAELTERQFKTEGEGR